MNIQTHKYNHTRSTYELKSITTK